jgi:hypothetical protein
LKLKRKILHRLLHAVDRSFQQAAVEVEADGINEPVLFHAQKITRAPYLKILHGELKA